MKIYKLYFLFMLILAMLGCSSVPENLSIAKKEVIDYYKSGKYEKELNDVIKNAENKFSEINSCDSCAVVFDVDETALSNFEINKKLDFGYVPSLWDKWIDEEKASAIKPVKNLYNFLLNKNFKIIFLTGRKDYQYDQTINNLKKVGYEKFDTLITRNKNEYHLSAVNFKSQKRIALTKKGYKIIGTVGDQFSDLEGPEHGIQVKIPNYVYMIK